MLYRIKTKVAPQLPCDRDVTQGNATSCPLCGGIAWFHRYAGGRFPHLEHRYEYHCHDCGLWFEEMTTPEPEEREELTEDEEDVRDRILSCIAPLDEFYETFQKFKKMYERGEVYDLDNFDCIPLEIHCDFANIMMQHVTDLLSDGVQ